MLVSFSDVYFLLLIILLQEVWSIDGKDMRRISGILWNTLRETVEPKRNLYWERGTVIQKLH